MYMTDAVITTPSSPMNHRSCQLYRMPTRLMAMLVTISDEPLAQAPDDGPAQMRPHDGASSACGPK